MDWASIATLIVQYGLPFVEKLVSNITSEAEVTPQAWAELIALTKQTARDRMLNTLTQQGIDPNSDKGKALLALAS